MEFEAYLRVLFAFLFVIGLIAILAVLARRLGLGYRTRIRPGQPRRLSLVEVMPLDSKRRLMLVRRDNTEHLLVLGPSTEVVIETGIAAPPDFAAALGATTGPAEAAR